MVKCGDYEKSSISIIHWHYVVTSGVYHFDIIVVDISSEISTSGFVDLNG